MRPTTGQRLLATTASAASARALLGRREAAGDAGITVAIADRNDGDSRRPRGRPGGAVADRCAAFDVAHLDDAALERDHRLHQVLRGRRRVDAVERRAWPHHVAMGGGAEKDAGGIGERGGDAAEQVAQLAEPLGLDIVEVVTGGLGAGEMGHDERDAVVGHLHPGGERGRFLDRQAEPVHAGIEMQGGATQPAARAAKRIPFDELGHGADHRPRVDRGIGGGAAGGNAVEHVNDRLGRGCAHLAGLGEMGDEECPAAVLGELGGHRLEAAAIGIRLHHGGAIGRHRALHQRAPVEDDGAEIDGQDAAGLQLRGTGSDLLRRCGRRGVGRRLGQQDWSPLARPERLYNMDCGFCAQIERAGRLDERQFRPPCLISQACASPGD